MQISELNIIQAIYWSYVSPLLRVELIQLGNMHSVKTVPLTANEEKWSALSKAHPMQDLPAPAAGYTHKG